MDTYTLVPRPHTYKRGDTPAERPASITTDTILQDQEGNAVGLYLQTLPPKLAQLVAIADAETRNPKVPKSMMDRKKPVGVNANGTIKYEIVSQWSIISGSMPAKPHMRRNYPNRSTIHRCKAADTYCKAMSHAGREALALMAQLVPTVHATHMAAINANVQGKWLWAQGYTSSLTNCNIAAQMHTDNLNIKYTYNSIICKRANSTGGNLFIPDYDITFAQPDSSLLIYPVWQNLHGVTPIVPTHPGGYRNTHVFYALEGFKA